PRPCRPPPRIGGPRRTRCPRWPAAAGRCGSGMCSRLPGASLNVGELGVPDPDPVSGMEGLGAIERLIVEVGAVGRAQVLDHQHMALLPDTRVPGGGE